MKKPKYRMEIFNEVKTYLKPLKGSIWTLVIVKLLLVIVSLITPFFFKLLIDEVMIKGQLGTLKLVCLLYGIAFVISTLLLSAQRIIGNRVYKKFSFNIRYKLWRIYMKMPQDIYSRYSTGDLKNRVENDAESFHKFMEFELLDYAFSWLTVIATASMLVYVNWKLALFGFLMIPISFWMTKWLGSKLKASWQVVRQTQGEYDNWLQGSIQSWKEIKALNLEKEQSRIFTGYWHKLSKQIFAGRMYWFGNRCFIAMKDFFITKMNLYFIGGLLIINGELTIGSLLVFMKYYEQLFQNIGNINDTDLQLSTDLPAMERVIEILNIEAKECNKTYVLNKPILGSIEFNKVSFRYGAEDFITELTLKVEPKEKLAIVGRSGCGKTTLAKLILALNYASAGEILIDGQNIAEINPVSLHKNIGAVMQDGSLFNMSIRDNLMLAKPDASDSEIIEACKKAYIHDFVTSLEKGYDTLIGEKGVKLSGGQKQRMAIAKVMLSAPGIVIFDEATSSLDQESEKIIHKAIDNISKDRTIIIIAHRLSSIMNADRVIVLDEGKIVGEGTHKELLGNNEIYDLLFKKQCVQEEYKQEFAS